MRIGGPWAPKSAQKAQATNARMHADRLHQELNEDETRMHFVQETIATNNAFGCSGGTWSAV